MKKILLIAAVAFIAMGCCKKAENGECKEAAGQKTECAEKKCCKAEECPAKEACTTPCEKADKCCAKQECQKAEGCAKQCSQVAECPAVE